MRGLFAATARGVVLPVAFLAAFFFTVAIGHHRYHEHNILGAGAFCVEQILQQEPTTC
jgi:hypothetical protein